MIYLQLHLIVLVKNAKEVFVRQLIYGICGLLLSYVTVNECDISLDKFTYKLDKYTKFYAVTFYIYFRS